MEHNRVERWLRRNPEVSLNRKMKDWGTQDYYTFFENQFDGTLTLTEYFYIKNFLAND